MDIEERKNQDNSSGGAIRAAATSSSKDEMKDAVRSDKEKVVDLSKRMLRMFSGHKTSVITASIKLVEKEIGSESVYNYRFER